MKYIGCRSTKLGPTLDACYLGSGKALPERTIKSCIKTVLAEFPTREEAIQAEIDYIKDNDCVNSPDYYNLRLATYDRHGTEGTPVNTGRTKETHEYIVSANEKRKQYVGEYRTPAQKAADNRARGVSTGPNPAKGKIGINNSGFNPWYLIDPKGNYLEIMIPKQDYAEKLGVTPRQLGHRFHHTNMHKPAKQGPLKGWTFGNLPRPTNTGAD